MTPEQFANVILAAVGIVLQLAFTYLPGFSDWFQTHPQKGLIALGFDVAFGAIYFALGCVPAIAALVGISLTCDVQGAYTLLQAVFVIAVSQLTTYSFMKNQVRAKQERLWPG